MAVTINASTTTGLVQSADTSGTIELQSNGTTKLTVSSSGVNIGQMNGGAITSGTAVASTSGTSIDFTSIPSWVKRIIVMFNAVSTNGSSIVQVQIGSGSVTTSGYAGSATGMGVGVTSNLYTSGLVLFTNNESSSAVRVGQAVITLVSGNIYSMSANTSLTNVATTSLTSSVVTLGGVLDRVRITTVNGTDTFDAGTINILYEG